MVKNPPSNAGKESLITGWGAKIPHAAEQLSTQNLEPQLEKTCMLQQRPSEAKRRKDTKLY